MRSARYLTLVAVYLLILGCNNAPHISTTQPGKKACPVKIDTSKSFKIGDTWVTPKPKIDFNKLTKFAGDTLGLVICGDYVYSPFGEIKDKSSFKSSLLSNFRVTSRVEKDDTGTFEFNSLQYRSSKLLFFFDNDPEASRHSSIFKGEIYNADIRFANGVKVGMPVANFYKKLFDYFPAELATRYKVVVLQSCVEDITHTYTFDGGKLASVKFITDSYWKVDY